MKNCDPTASPWVDRYSVSTTSLRVPHHRNSCQFGTEPMSLQLVAGSETANLRALGRGAGAHNDARRNVWRRDDDVGPGRHSGQEQTERDSGLAKAGPYHHTDSLGKYRVDSKSEPSSVANVDGCLVGVNVKKTRNEQIADPRVTWRDFSARFNELMT